MKRFNFSAGMILLLAVGTALVLLALSPDSAKSSYGRINFSHQKHKDMGECAGCHPAAESDNAGDNLLPKPEICTTCHDEKDVRVYWNIEQDRTLEDVRIVPKERHLYFSHAFHVTTTKLECQSCHGRLLTAEDEKVVSGIPEMEICASCHNNARKSPLEEADGGHDNVATGACEACHTTLAGLHPQNHRVAEFIKEHGRFAMMGGNETECSACHSVSFCQECHSPYNVVNDAGTMKNFTVPASPRAETIDNPSRMAVQKRHTLTYRFTHGFDARAQASRCEICHQQETFCTPCHQNGFDEAGIRVVPQSHQIAGFASYNGGRAMNRHAKLAAMNIESCVVCHNVEGADPICVTCHENGFAPKGGK